MLTTYIRQRFLTYLGNLLEGVDTPNLRTTGNSEAALRKAVAMGELDDGDALTGMLRAACEREAGRCGRVRLVTAGCPVGGDP